MMVALSSRLLFLAAASFSIVLFVSAFYFYGFVPQHEQLDRSGIVRYSSVRSRKLLQQVTNRMDEGCSPEDIVVYQGATTPLPNGIPTYTVQILNECIGIDGDGGGCSIGAIHLACGWFSSARLVDPSLFRRIGHNNCLVNDGRPIKNGESVTFEYANSFKYPLYVRDATCGYSSSSSSP